jgi:membrane fusion protein (multidrug efflux system)
MPAALCMFVISALTSRRNSLRDSAAQMTFPVPFPRRACLATLLAAALAAGCAKKPDAPKPPPPVVGVITVQPSSVPIDIELPGRTAPFQTSDVRPQVTGILLKRLFVEGTHVRAGQPLYRIDPAPYRAALGQAQGNLASAQANAVAARLKAGRYSDLEKLRAVARQDADDARATAGQADASIKQTASALDAARINLDYTTIRAPISGTISRSIVTPGALVTASQTDALATIQTLDPIYVDIQQSSSELLALRKAMMSGGAVPAEAPVTLKLEDGTAYAGTGRLEFAEVTVDPSTGSVLLRARFPNPTGFLLPGMFVRAVVTQTRRNDVFQLPAQAVQHNPRGDASVMVVGAGNKIEQRPVETQAMQGDSWVITKGLKAGDRVVIEGTGNAKPGTVVRPTTATGSVAESAIITPPSKGQANGGGAAAGK